MSTAHSIVQHLLETEDDLEPDDFKDMADMATPEQAKSYQMQTAWELQRREREKSDQVEKQRLEKLKAEILNGNFSVVSRKDIVNHPNLVPSSYWRARSKLYSLARRKAGASPNASTVSIQNGSEPPRIIHGNRGGWFTKGGTPIEHPGAYGKVGWSNMDYRTNDEEVEVGIDWLYSTLPKTTRRFLKYAGLDPAYGPATVSSNLMADEDEEHLEKHNFAYNFDDPPLAESLFTFNP
jgi:anti-sigma28 factor (negative regulator of flagellin synthesis)